MVIYFAVLFEHGLTAMGQLFKQVELLLYIEHFGLDVSSIEVATIDQTAAQLPQPFHVHVETGYVTSDNFQFLYQTLDKWARIKDLIGGFTSIYWTNYLSVTKFLL